MKGDYIEHDPLLGIDPDRFEALAQETTVTPLIDQLTRERILERDHHTCQLRLSDCTSTASTVTVIDETTTGDDNLRAACEHCARTEWEQLEVERIKDQPRPTPRRAGALRW
jgi:hypothetical protein